MVDGSHPITRRDFLALTTLATLGSMLGSAAGAEVGSGPEPHALNAMPVPPSGALDLVIRQTAMNVAGRKTRAPITINGTIPGPTLRMREGQDVVLRVHNALRREVTSIHWHGLLVPTDMDGVPGVSFPGIGPGETFTYRFKLRQYGTYWYHSHSGFQEQLGHYGALIIDPAEPEPFTYDREYVIVLSDWTFEDPHRVFEKLKIIRSYYNFQRQTVADLIQRAHQDGVGQTLRERLAWDRMRMDPTDIADVTGATYTYLMNGLSPAENWTAIAEPGQRVRLRLINAATSTFFDFRIPGLPMTMVAADGNYVRPVETDELRIAVAETYDLLVTLPDRRAYTLFAETMDRSGHARGTLAPNVGMSAAVPARRQRPMLSMADMGMAAMSGGGMEGMAGMDMPSGHSGHDMGTAQQNAHLPTEDLPASMMHGPDHHGRDNSSIAMEARRRFAEPGLGLGQDGWRVLRYADLRNLRSYPDRRAPDRQFDMHLTGNMASYIWSMDGKKFSDADMVRLVYGERVRINMINDTMMSHPMHLHGMWMDLYAGGSLQDFVRKHTVAVKPGELLSVDITVDAPGQWAFHCHLLYHMEAGMFRTFAVVRSLGGGQSHG